MYLFQRLSCKSVACQCPIFGDGCFANTAPPCGRDCVSTLSLAVCALSFNLFVSFFQVASSCQLGCSDANSHLNNNLSKLQD